MTESPKTVMIVAGGEWQLPIIAEAKRLGHRVLNTNLYENSPGFALADLAEVVDVLDVDGNIEIARLHHPDAVLTDQSDIAVRTVALVAEALDLPGIGRDVAERFTNKLAMRTWCRDLGVTQPDFVSCSCVHEAQRRAAAVGFPLVMKPPASQSSRGVRRVDDLSQIEAAFCFAQQFSNDGSVLVENFIDGTELTAEGVATASGHVTLAISTKDHLPHNPMVARRLVYSSYHADIPFEELRTQNDHLINGMGLAFGLTHTEYKYSDGEFVLIETAARGGGTKISSHIVPYMSDVATNSMLIGMSLGQVDRRAPGVEYGSSHDPNSSHFPAGRVAAIEGLDEARSLAGVIDVGLTFAVGDVLMPPATTDHATFTSSLLDRPRPRPPPSSPKSSAPLSFVMSETTAGIRIFDSLTHPTPTGNWLDPRHDGVASANDLVQQMKLCGVERVLAVGMGDAVGGYTETDYASWVRDAVPGSTPIAFVAFDERDQSARLSDHLGKLRELGYRGVKIHPRLTRTTFGDPRLVEVLAAAALYDLRVLVCSYNFGHPEYASGELGPAYLMAAIDAAPGAKVIVLHGGGCNVLEWSEWVRPRHDVLLDLSFTIARYAGSSVDLDLEYLFDSFDQRLCVGSDHPQFDLFTLRQRFDKFAGGISREKADRIAFGNLADFFPEDAR